MELANQFRIRDSLREDAQSLTRLLETAPFTHWHLDWRLPVDWLGSKGFLVAEGSDAEMLGCLALIPDPLPAAWVRVAAVDNVRQAPQLLSELWQRVMRHAATQEISDVAWLQPGGWPTNWFSSLQLQQSERIESYVKEDLFLPALRNNPALKLRVVRDADLPELVAIEAAAFDPIWRHSEEGLRQGKRAAISFKVAELDGELVGFQYSSHGQGNDAAHLVRMTVSPKMQGQQVGSALLADAIKGYWNRRLTRISLNTQESNLPSQRLYAKFGFYPVGVRVPVWTCRL